MDAEGTRVRMHSASMAVLPRVHRRNTVEMEEGGTAGGEGKEKKGKERENWGGMITVERRRVGGGLVVRWGSQGERATS